MMLKLSPSSAEKGLVATRQQWVPVVLLALALAGCTFLLTGLDPVTSQGIPRWHATPRDFGYTLFKEYALAVEIVSFQLLFAAVGAFYVARPDTQKNIPGGAE
jgi:NADH-quinone oxidoreductase subunit J